METSEKKPSVFDIFTKDIRRKLRVARLIDPDPENVLEEKQREDKSTHIVSHAAKTALSGQMRRDFTSHIDTLEKTERDFLSGESTLAPDIHRSHEGFRQKIEKTLDERIQNVHSVNKFPKVTSFDAGASKTTQNVVDERLSDSIVEQKELSLEELLENLRRDIVYATTYWDQHSTAKAYRKNEEGKFVQVDEQLKEGSASARYLRYAEDSLNKTPLDYQDIAWKKFKSLYSPDEFRVPPTFRHLIEHVLFVGVFKEQQDSDATTIVMTGNVAYDSLNIIGSIAIKLQIKDGQTVDQFLAWLQKDPNTLLSKLTTQVLGDQAFEDKRSNVHFSIKEMIKPTVVVKKLTDQEQSVESVENNPLWKEFEKLVPKVVKAQVHSKFPGDGTTVHFRGKQRVIREIFNGYETVSLDGNIPLGSDNPLSKYNSRLDEYIRVERADELNTLFFSTSILPPEFFPESDSTLNRYREGNETCYAVDIATTTTKNIFFVESMDDRPADHQTPVSFRFIFETLDDYKEFRNVMQKSKDNPARPHILRKFLESIYDGLIVTNNGDLHASSRRVPQPPHLVPDTKREKSTFLGIIPTIKYVPTTREVPREPKTVYDRDEEGKIIVVNSKGERVSAGITLVPTTRIEFVSEEKLEHYQ